MHPHMYSLELHRNSCTSKWYSLFDKLCNISFLSFYLGKGLEKPSEGLKVQAFLLFEEKQSFRKLGDIIYQQNKSGEIYVRRDALTVIYGEHLLYGNLVTYGRSGLRQLWNLVFARDSPLQGKGLLALGLLNAVIVWPRKKPNHLGCVTGKGLRTIDFNLVSEQMPLSAFMSAAQACSEPYCCLVVFWKCMDVAVYTYLVWFSGFWIAHS